MNLKLTQAMLDALPKEEYEYIMQEITENAEPEQMAAILGITAEKSLELHDSAWRKLAKMMVDDAKERGEF